MLKYFTWQRQFTKTINANEGVGILYILSVFSYFVSGHLASDKTEYLWFLQLMRIMRQTSGYSTSPLQKTGMSAMFYYFEII